MFPAQFEYYKAGSVDEALSLLAEHGDREVELLAGGHSLLPTMKSGLASPDVLVDIGGIDDLRGVSRNGDAISVGALTPYADVAGDEAVHKQATAFAEATQAIGDIQVRNRGTVGGNLAHADPASDLPAAVLAADATVHAAGPDGSRTIPADDFFTGLYSTALEEGELLTAVEVPIHDVGGYAKKPSPSSGYAMVGVAAVLGMDDGTVESARVAATGAADRATRLTAVEDALVGTTLDADSAASAAHHAADGIDPSRLMDDTQASAEYRSNLLGVYTERALAGLADGQGTTVAH